MLYISLCLIVWVFDCLSVCLSPACILCTTYMYILRGQKRASDFTGLALYTDGWKLTDMWVLGSESGPLEEQPALLTAEPALQPHVLLNNKHLWTNTAWLLGLRMAVTHTPRVEDVRAGRSLEFGLYCWGKSLIKISSGCLFFPCF